MTSETAILIAAGLATAGWLYTGRRARMLSRKQHTINVLTQTYFNKEFQDAMQEIGPMIKAGKLPDLSAEENGSLHKSLRKILNHYEFIAAGLRNGDVDEVLVRDSQRGTIITLFEVCTAHIYKLRDTRRRQAIYEHLEWLHRRWEKYPPKLPQRVWERAVGRPICGTRAVARD